jgi:hypothetical protein
MISIREEIAIAMLPEVLWPIPKFLTPTRENRQLDNFNRLRAGGQANRLFPAAK